MRMCVQAVQPTARRRESSKIIETLFVMGDAICLFREFHTNGLCVYTHLDGPPVVEAIRHADDLCTPMQLAVVRDAIESKNKTTK